MRSFFFIFLSILSINLFSNNDSYDPNNWNRDLNQKEKRRYEEKASHDDRFTRGISQIPGLNVIVTIAILGYVGYSTICNWLGYAKLPQDYYDVRVRDRTIRMTREEYSEYEQAVNKEMFLEYCYPEPQLSLVIPKEYVIAWQRSKDDYPKYQQYNQILKEWINKNIDPKDIPDRYKKKIPIISNDCLCDLRFDCSSDLQNYINEHSLDIEQWKQFYGNEVQYALHCDSIALLEQSRQPFKSIWIREHKYELVRTIDAGRALNAQGYCTKAAKVNNFCAALMDYATAIWDGYSSGIQSRIPETITQAAVCAGTIAIAVFVPGVKEAMLCYTAFQLSVEIGYTFGLATSDHQEHKTALNAKFQGITDRFKGVDNGTYTLEHSAYDFAYTGGQASADYALMKIAGKLIKYAKKAAQKLRKYHRKRQGEFVATIPDGQIFKVIDGGTRSNLYQNKSDKNACTRENKIIQYSAIKQLDKLNFSKTAVERMSDPARFVPIHLLENVICNPQFIASDPQGSNARMFYSQIFKDGQLYNIEVLFNEETRTIYHFLYTKKSKGPLSKV